MNIFFSIVSAVVVVNDFSGDGGGGGGGVGGVSCVRTRVIV